MDTLDQEINAFFGNGQNNGWESDAAVDAFRESEHPRGEGGKFSIGARMHSLGRYGRFKPDELDESTAPVDKLKLDQALDWGSPWWGDAEFKEEDVNRDPEGKFATQEGGGAGAEPDKWTGERPANPVRAGDLHHSPEARTQFVSDLAKQYGVEPPPIFIDDEMPARYEGHPDEVPLASLYAGREIRLNPDFWNDPDKLAKLEKTSHNLLAGGATAEAALVHEFGHYVDAKFSQSMPPGIEVRSIRGSFYNKWLTAKDAIISKYFDNKSASPSLYADEHPSEWVAEAFAAVHMNKALDVPEDANELQKAYGTRGLEASKALWKELYQWHKDMLAAADKELAKQRRRQQKSAA